MKILILDDDDRRHRDFDFHLLADHSLTHAHTYDEFIRELEANTFDVIFFDHDLNYEQYVSRFPDGREITGYHCAKWLIENQQKSQPKHIVVHSHNQGGAMHIMALLREAGHSPIYWEHTPLQHPLRTAGLDNP